MHTSHLSSRRGRSDTGKGSFEWSNQISKSIVWILSNTATSVKHADNSGAANSRSVDDLQETRVLFSVLPVFVLAPQQQSWNHFSVAQLNSIYSSFLALLEDPRRGLLPLSKVVSLLRSQGLSNEKVAYACAKFFDVDGNWQVSKKHARCTCWINSQHFAHASFPSMLM
jgi:hypothetical protein